MGVDTPVLDTFSWFLIIIDVTINRNSAHRKHPSGAQKRKQKRQQHNENEQMLRKVPKLTTYFVTPSTQENAAMPQSSSQSELNTPETDRPQTDEIRFDDDASNSMVEYQSLNELPHTSATTTEQLEYTDPALWPLVLTDNQRKLIVEKGPNRVKDHEYPLDKNGRRFLETYYSRCLSNGEKINRVWLVYSSSDDKVFCFCCKLFRPDEKMALTTEGLCDWKNINRRLSDHEVSKKTSRMHANLDIFRTRAAFTYNNR